MKILGAFRYELLYQLRTLSNGFYFFVLFGFTFFFASVFTEEAKVGDYFLNSPFAISQVSLISFLLGLVILAPIAGNAATRDFETRIHPLFYTTPITKSDYIFGRLLAVFLLGACMMLAVPLGLIFAILFPGDYVELLGPLSASSYFSSYLLFLLPNTLIATSFMFGIALLTRHGATSYLISGIMFFTAMTSWAFVANELGHWTFGKLLDSIGLTIMGELDKIWTSVEKNTLMPGYQKSVILNRTVWFLISLVFFIITFHSFKFRHVSKSKKKLKSPDSNILPINREKSLYSNEMKSQLLEVKQSFGFSSRFLQLTVVTLESFKKIVLGWGGFISICLLIFLIITLPITFSGNYYGPELPSTGDLVNILTQDIWFVVPLLIIYYAGELMWLHRENRANGIIDVSPVPVWISFFGKFLGLLFSVIIIQLVLCLAGILAQLRMGYHNFELGIYLKMFLGIQMIDYALLIVLALSIQVLINQKYLAHFITLCFYLLKIFGPQIGIEPGLLIYASDPGISYSDMRGLSPFLIPWIWFKIYWTTWALILAFLAKKFWPRGYEKGLVERWKEGRRRFTRANKSIFLTLLSLMVIFAGVLFYNTKILHKNFSSSDLMERTVSYEFQYKKYSVLLMPSLVKTTTKVEVYAKERSVSIDGNYSLVNQTNTSIDTIIISTLPETEYPNLRFDRVIKNEMVDWYLGHRMYVLEESLLPGDTLDLNFSLYHQNQGFAAQEINTSVVENGTYFGNPWFPKIGYQEGREIQNSQERDAQGLPEIPEKTLELARLEKGPEYMDLEVVIGIDIGQIAIAPGKLLDSWKENGRNYFRYSTESPILNKYAFFAADYDHIETQWKSTETGQVVDISLFYHQDHTWNIERIFESATASLDYLNNRLGQYPHSQLRFIEKPGYSNTLFAFPINIMFDEGFAHLNPGQNPRDIDLPFAIIAHEISHQWWGHQLTPASIKGSALLTETLATFSALEIVEEAQGKERFNALLNRMRQTFLNPQVRAKPPLIESNKNVDITSKGPLALYSLREYIGKDKVGSALTDFYNQFKSGTSRLPVPLDLILKLKEVAPDSLVYLVDDLFAKNTFWDIELENVTAHKINEEQWKVNLELSSRKYTIDHLGKEEGVDMDDWVQIGFLREFAEEGSQTYDLHWKRVTSGESTIEIILPYAPKYSVIDPNFLLFDLEVYNNRDEVR